MIAAVGWTLAAILACVAAGGVIVWLDTLAQINRRYYSYGQPPDLERRPDDDGMGGS